MISIKNRTHDGVILLSEYHAISIRLWRVLLLCSSIRLTPSDIRCASFVANRISLVKSKKRESFTTVLLSLPYLSLRFRLFKKHRTKPMPSKLLASQGSPFGRAPAIAGERALYCKFSILSLITLSIIRQTPSKFSSTALFENRKT